ncbi:uncharacterized protein EAE98_008150 [Botrytis deweyae]|uniref:Uncharacterized protein n=1 Tax=Botrytis deweyae TaxID=2478750 RepID=A0ABQ7IGL2_9HELO|nr:uncharacterized protein EAE98_008150 [Botrytis deweyae]KAF7922624.1 hypothetical protein EAE98_008150 [Botrytis deweyae]
MWIIQEIAMASGVIFLYGDATSITYEQLAVAIRFLSNELKLARAASNYRRVACIRNTYQSGSLDLRRAMALAKGSVCKWPQDRVYALAGFSSDGSILVPITDYEKTLEEISCDFNDGFCSKGRLSRRYINSSYSNLLGPLTGYPHHAGNATSTVEKIKRIANVDFGHEIRSLHTRSYNGRWLNLMGTQLGTAQI